MAVLEGDFANLCVAGSPLSLSMQLQTSRLKLADAMWTAKSSTGGFSVSFFWPSVSSKQPVNIKVKKQKRRKREKTKAKKSAQCENSGAEVAVATPNSAANTPVDAHHSPEFLAKNSSPVQRNLNTDVNLKSCSSVRYDKRGAVHGVTYGGSRWTPVVGKRSRRQKRSVPLHLLRLRAPPHVKNNLASSDESTGSDCLDTELVIPDQARLEISMVDGKPGLQIHTKYTRSWTPIAVLKPS